MEAESQLTRNADELQSALDRRLRDAAALDRDDRLRRAQAIEQASQYVALLREAAQAGSGAVCRYWFKLVFADGRWSVAEKLLAEPPRVGDHFSFDGGTGDWRVSDSQHVWPLPSRKPRREFFVCAPAA